jgi:serine/threonine protein kinase
LKYEEIFFLGTEKSKEQLRFNKILLNNHSQYNFFKVIEGDHIGFRYQVLSEIGRGAFGQVIKCLDHKFDKIVAIKVIKNDP